MSASSHPMQTRSKTAMTFDLRVPKPRHPVESRKKTPEPTFDLMILTSPEPTFDLTISSPKPLAAVTFIRVVAEAQRQGVPVEHLVTWFSDEEVPYRSELLLYGAIQTVADILGVDALDVYTVCREAIQASQE